jgi:hypothetical protein
LAVAITSIAGARLTASALDVDEKKDIERDGKFKKYSPPMSLLPYFTDLLTIKRQCQGIINAAFIRAVFKSVLRDHQEVLSSGIPIHFLLDKIDVL